ncbi:MAG: hypothetical protein OEY22_11085 [Candidatus Bathyarchaeota archaeon]|nr:hypothetical protein [Candidatus Bathyarchaeota archaeon]
MIDINQLLFIFIIICLVVILPIVIWRLRKGKAPTEKWSPIVIQAIITCMAIALSLITIVTSSFYFYYGYYYPGQSSEDIRKLMLYCIIAAFVTIIYSTSSVMNRIGEATRKTRKRKKKSE